MSNPVQKTNDTQMVSTAVTPMHMLQVAVDKGADLDKIERLMDLDRRWKSDMAREAFYEALAAFKRQSVVVVKDKKNKQYGSSYASIGNQVNTVNESLANFGLNTRWDIDQSEGQISITCILSHTLGHCEKVTMRGEPDTSGAKNKLQQIKSTVTYLELATHQAVTGVVASDAANLDDDGNASGVGTLSDEQVKELDDLIKDVGADKAQFMRFAKVDSLDQILAKNLKFAKDALEQKRKPKADG